MGCLVLPQRFGFSPQMSYFKMKVPFAYNPKPSTLTISPPLLLQPKTLNYPIHPNISTPLMKNGSQCHGCCEPQLFNEREKYLGQGSIKRRSKLQRGQGSIKKKIQNKQWLLKINNGGFFPISSKGVESHIHHEWQYMGVTSQRDGQLAPTELFASYCVLLLIIW